MGKLTGKSEPEVRVVKRIKDVIYKYLYVLPPHSLPGSTRKSKRTKRVILDPIAGCPESADIYQSVLAP